jgi:hypothetical protein
VRAAAPPGRLFCRATQVSIWRRGGGGVGEVGVEVEKEGGTRGLI